MCANLSHHRDVAIEVSHTSTRRCDNCQDAFNAAFATLKKRGFEAKIASKLAMAAASLWLARPTF